MTETVSTPRTTVRRPSVLIFPLLIAGGLVGGTAAFGPAFLPLGTALAVAGFFLRSPGKAKARDHDGPVDCVHSSPDHPFQGDEADSVDGGAPEDRSASPGMIEKEPPERLPDLTADFDAMGDAIQDGRFAARSLSQNASETSDHAKDVARAAGNTAQGVQAVAAAAEELSQTTSEIARQIVLSTDEASTTAREVGNANETITALTEAAREIGAVVDVIREIADQTNLLALNATIEAARAGDAGRGFAVVASEVKALAQETAKATGTIGKQIIEIQGRVDSAVTAIRSIGKRVIGINEIITGISAATEEQSAATNEITANVASMAEAATEISNGLDLLCMSAEQTDGFSEETHMAFDAIATAAEALKSSALALSSDRPAPASDTEPVAAGAEAA